MLARKGPTLELEFPLMLDFLSPSRISVSAALTPVIAKLWPATYRQRNATGRISQSSSLPLFIDAAIAVARSRKSLSSRIRELLLISRQNVGQFFHPIF